MEEMKLLFAMDRGNYDPAGRVFARHSARSIVIRAGKVAMVRSEKYDYYKFPGGGMEPGEQPVDAMIRETREEAGLQVLPGTIRPYGYVHRVSPSDHPDAEIFLQDNFYFLCQAEETQEQKLDEYEAEEGFHLTWMDPETAITVNRCHPHGNKDQEMLEREALVLERLMAEGLLGT